MTITITWSWFAFGVGFVSALVFLFLVLLSVAFSKWSKTKKAAEDASSKFMRDLEEWQNSNKKQK
jgi:hypothetical protein